MFKGLDSTGSSPQFSDMDFCVSSFRRNCYVSTLLHTHLPTYTPTRTHKHSRRSSALRHNQSVLQEQMEGSVMHARLTCFKHMHSASKLKQSISTIVFIKFTETPILIV